MANGLLLQYVNKRKNDYKHFMGVSSLPSFELISKHISLSDANASGCGALATHRLKCGKICGNHNCMAIMSYFTN